MFVDTGANVTLLRTDLAQKLKEQLIYTDPNISLKTATGEKTEIRGKLDASIECGSRKFQHRIYVADVTDPCILGLDFLKKKRRTRYGQEERKFLCFHPVYSIQSRSPYWPKREL
ncbi:hypothetical protein AVEN_117827-1 [Araneus ventricosus]|uniref:Peptidase A2 domain-containing protein n=1 Tax=Araneus ventricosus TaxID=182803 RepID=A0A4Y2B7S4_ARAVE|nr:hypothetical protein AVEN_117827-1 [Araneus ventricosus]